VIDHDERKPGSVPLYETVRQQLKADLDRGRWKPGEMLPTESEIGKHFGVSIGTVRQAVLSLVRMGLLTRHPGKGTFVARLDTRRGFARFFRFHDELGATITPSIKHIDTLKLVDPQIAAQLQLPAETQLVRIRRTLSWNDEAICIYASYLDGQRFKGIEKLSLEGKRLYAVLEEEYGLHVVGVEEKLKAGHPAADEADLLSLPHDTPVMLLERTAFLADKTIVDWRRTIGRSDRFYYKIDLP
jgi:GntR family transcriptional regulator